jgi:hypothetical protein
VLAVSKLNFVNCRFALHLVQSLQQGHLHLVQSLQQGRLRPIYRLAPVTTSSVCINTCSHLIRIIQHFSKQLYSIQTFNPSRCKPLLWSITLHSHSLFRKIRFSGRSARQRTRITVYISSRPNSFSPTPSSVEVKERVELYLYYPSRPSWTKFTFTSFYPYNSISCDTFLSLLYVCMYVCRTPRNVVMQTGEKAKENTSVALSSWLFWTTKHATWSRFKKLSHTDDERSPCLSQYHTRDKNWRVVYKCAAAGISRNSPGGVKQLYQVASPCNGEYLWHKSATTQRTGSMDKSNVRLSVCLCPSVYTSAFQALWTNSITYSE